MIVTDVKAYPYGDIPGPIVGTDIQINTGAVLTEFTTGRVRKRLSGYGVNYVSNMQWIFKNQEIAIFKAWWQNVLFNGSAEFLMTHLPLFGDYDGLWTGLFTTDPQVISIEGPNVTVNATISFRDVPELSWGQFLTALNPDWQLYFNSIPEAINNYYNGKWNNALYNHSDL
jgi:hypothetical protein